ncbi:MAG: hypothetical protein GY778_06135 [bacterium]|nr:hypothetical protein [bacterium]
MAGDLLWTGIQPKPADGFPAEWAAVLDRIADELGPSSVVSGHGPPGTAADITAMADYLRKVDTMLAAARAGDLDPHNASPPRGFENWSDLNRFRSGLAKLAVRG